MFFTNKAMNRENFPTKSNKLEIKHLPRKGAATHLFKKYKTDL